MEKDENGQVDPLGSRFAGIVEDVKRMTPDEFLQSLVEAGIVTPDCKLTPHYKRRGPRRLP